MDEIEAVFNRKDMTFEEAVKYFKERVPVSASVFYRIAGEIPGACLHRRRLHEGPDPQAVL